MSSSNDPLLSPANGAKSSSDKRKRVVVVGAGAAGMACASTLAQHPERFHVTLIESADVCGGQATSIPLDAETYGASWLNNGVQGGSQIFAHNFNFFEKYGHKAEEVKLQVAFGKGEDGFWTNVFPSQLVDKYRKDIKKFGKWLQFVKYLMPAVGWMPLKFLVKLGNFSKGFPEKMVIPLMALFLGTGNQTPNVASAILERLFQDPNMKLWSYSPDTLLPNLPTMYTFPKLHDFYQTWADDLRSKEVDIRLKTEVTTISSRSKSGVTLWTKSNASDGPKEEREEHYDDIVLAVLADTALKLLGKTATMREKFVLGGAKFYDDITVTHSDSDYMKKHYEMTFDSSLCGNPKSEDERDQIAFAKGEKEGPDQEEPGFRPMYFTKSYAGKDAGKIEMSFDCSNYQHQFRQGKYKNNGDEQADTDARKNPHVFQTIFLDKNNEKLWTKGEIDKDKIIAENWWHQLGHSWTHYVRVVPGMVFINNNSKSTLFTGSWTLVVRFLFPFFIDCDVIAEGY